MAAPPSKTIQNLNGNWLMNKSLSGNPEPGLVLQGIGWLTRKAIGVASVSLEIKEFVSEPAPSLDLNTMVNSVTDHGSGGGSEAKLSCTRIDITQSASGLTSTTEARCLDDRWRVHEDWMFGKVRGRSRWSSDATKVGDDLTGGDAEVEKFLGEGWLEGPLEETGPGGARFVVSYVESLTAGWTALQVWGFQDVNDERMHVRKVVIRKGEEKAMFTLVYDFLLVGDGDEYDE